MQVFICFRLGLCSVSAGLLSACRAPPRAALACRAGLRQVPVRVSMLHNATMNLLESKLVRVEVRHIFLAVTRMLFERRAPTRVWRRSSIVIFVIL
eukprot:6214291-Pleurochrysis_carterae.AAC.2